MSKPSQQIGNKEFQSANTFVFQQQYGNKIPYLLSYPTSLQIELSTICNLSCTFCGRRDYRKQSASLFPKAALHRFDDFARHVPRVTLGGYGEPFTHEDIYQFLDYFAAKGCCLEIITNGTLVTQDDIAHLSRYPDLTVIVSLDEIEHGPSDRYRNINPAIVISCVENLARAGIKTGLHTLLTRLNQSQIARIATMAMDWRLQFLKLIYPHIFRRDLRPFMINSDLEGLSDLFGSLIELTAGNPLALHLPPIQPGVITPCYQPFETLFICHNQIVRPCCNLVFDDLYSLEVGSLEHQSLYEIWNGPRMITLRNQHYGKTEMDPKCRDCSFRSHKMSNYIKDDRA